MSSLRPCVKCGEHIAAGDRFCPRCGGEQPSSATSVLPGDQGSRWDEILKRLQAATEGRYQIRGLIGRGGMAAVYLADWPHMDLRIAIKVMDPYLLDHGNAVQRFLQEARTIAKLNHRNIIRVYDSGQAGDLYYFCMDYYPGRPLEQVLEAEGPLPVEVVRLWLWQAADALGYAHRQGNPVVHRDVKPSNMLLATDGDLVLTDFGIAKVRDLDSTSPAPSLTMPGAVLGTPAYLSPEQATGILDPQAVPGGAKVTGASDQYSLGVVAYEMLVGAPPFTGELMALLSAHARQDPRPITEGRPDCPRDLAEIVTRMLAKAPEDRWPDMQEICRALAVSSPPQRSPLRLQLSAIAKGHQQLTAISLSPVPDAFFEGQDFRLNATPLDLTGQPLSGRNLSWSSSDPDIAMVTQDGTVRALRAGAVCISASAEGISGEIQLSISPIPIDTVVVLPSHMNAAVGDTVVFRTLLLSGAGRELEGREVFWISSDPSVASVAPDGQVSALKPGTVTLTASSEERSSSATLTVIPPAVVAVEVTPSHLNIEMGGTNNLECVPRDSSGSPVEGRPVSWESASPSIAAVSETGQVAGLAPGTATIRAICEGVSGAASVTVARERIANLVLLPESPVVRKGETLQLFASPIGVSGSTLPDRVVDWSSTDSSVVGVDPTGRVSGIGPGAAHAIAQCEGAKASIQVLVTPPAVASIEITPTFISLAVGETSRLSAAPRADDGEILDGREIAWSSADPSLATIGADGEIHPVAVGRLQISATCEGKTASSEITVLPVPVAEIEFKEPTLSMELGDSRSLSPIVRTRDGGLANDRLLSWSSSLPEVVGVGPDGRLVALAVGTVSVRVESEGVSRAVTVEVVPVPVTEVQLTPASLQLHEGGEATVEAALFGRGGQPLEKRIVHWSSENPLVAEVDSDGVVVGKASGDTIVRATCEGQSHESPVAVSPAPASSVEVQPRKVSLRVGETRRLRALIRGPGGQPLKKRHVRWTSSDTTVATVDASGNLTGRAPGVVRIKAECEGVENSTSLTVRRSRKLAPFWVLGISAGAIALAVFGSWSLMRSPEGPLPEAPLPPPPVLAALTILSGDSLSMEAGTTLDLSLLARDAAGAELPPESIPNQSWQTTDSSVVTVSQAGILTAGRPGLARVQVSVEPATGGDPIMTSTLVVVAGSAAAETAATPPTSEQESPGTPVSPPAEVQRGEVAEPEEETAPSVTRIQILPSQGDLTEGETLQLRLVDQRTDPVSGTFRSTDPGVASVSPGGVVTALRAGQVTISGQFENFSAEANFRVSPAVVDPPIPALDSIRGRLTEVQDAGTQAQYDRAYEILDAIASDLRPMQEEYPRSSLLSTLSVEYLEVFRTLYGRCQRFRNVMQERRTQNLPTCRPPPTGGVNDAPVSPAHGELPTPIGVSAHAVSGSRPGRATLYP